MRNKVIEEILSTYMDKEVAHILAQAIDFVADREDREFAIKAILGLCLCPEHCDKIGKEIVEMLEMEERDGLGFII